MESLRMMGWGLVVAGISSVVVVAVVPGGTLGFAQRGLALHRGGWLMYVKYRYSLVFRNS